MENGLLAFAVALKMMVYNHADIFSAICKNIMRKLQKMNVLQWLKKSWHTGKNNLINMITYNTKFQFADKTLIKKQASAYNRADA